ncbi:hypothetical protein EJ06DRAFT_582193 [Trichodelitschia bisporula]|uniref:DNA replication checkpoint mediator MRC1 domain-containing protein n=1 Tax=Trichodelitschia bisporula TaxID=703511 RepID=A0A6G1HWE8_9PEZI|nr:hypothetical protein EJ06DRAFT_582193 [Trichodelitschia bisporula]
MSSPLLSPSATSTMDAPSQAELTPRSKVKAMLALFDDDSDGNDVSTSRTPSKKTSAAAKAPSKAPTVPNDKPALRTYGNRDASSGTKRRLAQPVIDDSTDDDAPAASPSKKARRSLSRTVSPGPALSGGAEISPARTIREESASLFVSPAPRRTREKSAGLFMSPAPRRTAPIIDSDSDSDVGSEARKRAEQQAKRRAEREARLKAAVEKAQQAESESDDNADEEFAKKLTQQQSRPSRKASKKAVEEMRRETQRLARNQQLTHEARVKKKITTKDLFKVFNFRQEESADASSLVERPDEEKPAVSGALVSSDAEARTAQGTPATSPAESQEANITQKDKTSYTTSVIHGEVLDDIYDDDEELPSLEEIVARPPSPKPVKEAPKPSAKAVGKRPVQQEAVITSGARHFFVVPPVSADTIELDSDDDLEIAPKKPGRLAIFDNIPKRDTIESQSLTALRVLAHVTSPGKAKAKGSSMTASEMHASLQNRARKQAIKDKEERLNALRAKGIIILTEEEREKEQIQIDNMLERARKEAMDLAKKEKADAKKDNPDGFADDSDDESWVGDAEDVNSENGGAEDEGEEEDIELSGSEDEDLPDADGLIDDAAEEDAEDDASEHEDAATAGADDMIIEDELPSVPAASRPAQRKRNVITDDDDIEDFTPAVAGTPAAKSITHDELAAAFGFQPNSSPVGLTQMFAGTMAESTLPPAPRGQTESPEFLRRPSMIPMGPAPTQPDFGVLVPNSQSNAAQLHSDPQRISATPGFSFDLGNISTLRGSISPSKFSEMPEPTQDVGFEISSTDLRQPQSTVDTLPLNSPSVKPKGRLRRRAPVSVSASEDSGSEAEQAVQKVSAYDKLFKASKKTAFDKKRSEAKGMIEEQAEESEDEYAGIGGASDDDSGEEGDEQLAEMIDESHVVVDERKMAQYYAEKDRVDDEKRIDKLYKAITTGGLRRRRGADMDELSDSENEAAERRRQKQREFARMRKALLEDENIGKIAENPKKMAFLRAIEDRDEDADFLDFMDEEPIVVAEDSQPAEEQPADASAQQPSSTIGRTVNPLKRTATTSFGSAKENARPRRASESPPKKAKTLAEIREAVSVLLDEPLVPDSQTPLDSDAESGSEAGEEDDADSMFHPPSFSRSSTSGSVVNRQALARADEPAAPSGPMAFHVLGSGSQGAGAFKPPTLLRRATSYATTATKSGVNVSATGVTTPSAGAMESSSEGVRRGGSSKSNIHYQAREAERRKVIDAAEKRRAEEVRRSVLKGRRSVLGSLGGKGGFE